MTYKPIFPDYENCCVNVLSSIAKKYGVDLGHKTNELVDAQLKNNPKNIVIILLDGMGKNILQRNLPSSSFLRSNVVSDISSVFPSVTTAGTMSFKTGLYPIEHGWLCFFLYFKEIGEAINLYLNTNAYSKKPVVQQHVAQTIMPYNNILSRIEEKQNGEVRAYSICTSESRDMYGISQLIYENFSEMCQLIKTLCSTDEKKVIYAYHPNPDTFMHKFGPYSKQAVDELLDIDAELSVLVNNCKDTLFIISADHGQTEVNDVIDIAEYPDIVNTLLMPPTGGTRSMNFFVKPEKHKEFEKLIKKYFKNKFLLYSKKQVLEMNLFGFGKPHNKIDDFIGDYWLISIDNTNLVYTTLYKLATTQPFGGHGGLTEEEMILPLIMYKTEK